VGVFMSVLTAQSQFLYFGLTAPNDVTYAMDIYPVRSDNLNIGVQTTPVTLKPSEFTFYTYPLTNNNVPPNTFVRITPNTPLATPLIFISSTTPFPTHFDTNPPPTMVQNLMVGNDILVPITDRFAGIYNPFNANDATYTIQLVNMGPVVTPTMMPVTAPAIFPTQNVVLGLSLPAIIGIASGGAVLIAAILVGVWIYSKRSKKRKEEAYKQVPNSENGKKPKEKVKEKANKEEEESSTPTSEEDSDTDEEENDYEDNYEDSYPAPRRVSSYGGGRRPTRGYGGPPKRVPNRGPSDSRRNRERSYSDDDDEDDYSSDDYS